MAVAGEDYSDSALEVGGALLGDRRLNRSFKLARSARQPPFTRQTRRRLACEMHVFRVKVLVKVLFVTNLCG